MIRYNYRPSLIDHAQLLILVRPFYNASESDYSFVLKKLTCYTHAKLEDSENRIILLKFTKGYSRDTLEWGKLQIHRRPLGFIGVAVLSNDRTLHAKDYEKIEHRFTNLIAQYDAFLYDSRCIIIGPDEPDIRIQRKDFFYIPLSSITTSRNFIIFLNDFISSIFVILESKRVDKISENSEKMLLPVAPIEQEQTITESDTRFLRRKLFGRNKKLLGDLSLISGLHQDALFHYTKAYDELNSINDFLWCGSALEGMCAASIIMQMGDNLYSSSDLFLTIAKSSVNVNVSNPAEDRQKTCLSLSQQDIITRYNECLTCYKKFSPAGPVELEGHLKFIRVLLHTRDFMRISYISQVVQSLLLIPLNYNDIEQIEQAVVLASIHEQVGLHRKAAFYRRSAALHYADLASESKLPQAMSLLQRVTVAYKIDLDTIANQSNIDYVGWPAVQLAILQDMLQVSRSLGNRLDCIRLLCFILEKYGNQMNWVDHGELVEMLEEYSESSNNESANTNVQLIRPIPIIRNFQPKKLSYNLQPFKANKSDSNGPFIFSSLSTKTRNKGEDTVWVCDDVAEVAMIVDNPLPVEIKVCNMTLLTEGVEFEAHPATLALPAESGSYPFMLLGTPKQHGNLIIKGYKLEVLGVTNSVMLPKPMNVVVTPALPMIHLNSTLPRSPSSNSLDPEDEDYHTLFTSANVYHGHSCFGKLTFENEGKVAVSNIDLKLKNKNEKRMVFNIEEITSKLPLAPGNILNLNVTLMPVEAWHFHRSADKLDVSLTMSYSFDGEGSSIYQRKVNWITHVKVMPSLEFTDICFDEIPRHPQCCCLSFDATNMTSVSMHVSGQILCDNLQNLGFVADQDCLEEKKILLEPKKKTHFSMHFPRVSCPPPENKRQTIENEYKKFIRDSVVFKWKLSDTNYNGVAYFQDFEVTSDMLKTLKPRHLDISIRVNNNAIREGEKILSNECQLVNISIMLSNKHDLDLENMILHVSPYQDCIRAREKIYELCLPSGSLSKVIKKLAPGETFEHSCGLIFLYEGEYFVDVCCSANQKIGSHFTSQQQRQRAYAVLDENTEEKMIPYSPRTVVKKIHNFDDEFWAQSFMLDVAA